MKYKSEIEAGIRTLYDATTDGFLTHSFAEAGHQHISHWLDVLKGSNEPALRPIAQELQTLLDALGSNNAAAMSKAFYTLGNLTSASALSIHSFEGLGDKIREISQKLTSAGGNMALIAQHQDGHELISAEGPAAQH